MHKPLKLFRIFCYLGFHDWTLYKLRVVSPPEEDFVVEYHKCHRCGYGHASLI